MSLDNPTLLLIDDDIATHITFKKALPDYTIITATSSAQALEILESNKPDIIVVDIIIPGSIDGHRLRDQIKKQFGEYCMIATTGFYDDSGQSQNRFMREGFAGTLLKPLDPGRLKSYISRTFNSYAQTKL